MKGKSKPRHGMLATMKDVAVEAKVSWITVSRALNSPDTVSEKTHIKIREAIEKLGYQPNLAAQSLASRSSRIIAVIVPTIANSLYANTVQGLSEILIPAGYQILLGNNAFSIDEEEKLVLAFLGRRPDGVVLTSPLHTKKLRQVLLASGIPIVETWSLPDKPLDIAVGYSDREAAETLAEYLLGKGYRKFAYITRPRAEFHFANVRWEAFRKFVARFREACPDPLLMERPGHIQSGVDAIHKLLNHDTSFDALVCGSSIFAVGALMELAAQGVPVPERMAVAGIGNVELAPFLTPPLTAISTEPYLIGLKSGEMMLSRLRNEKCDKDIINVGVKLICRSSA